MSIRIAEHLKEARNNSKTVLHSAITKYGWDCFVVEEVEHPQLECLNEREIYWISYYNSYKDGYNMTVGGDGVSGIDNALVEDILNSWQLGYTVSEISLELRHDDRTITAILEKLNIGRDDIIGRANRNREIPEPKKVVQIDIETGVILKKYQSIMNASKMTGISAGSISQCCKEKSHSGGGYLWRYANMLSKEEVEAKQFLGELPERYGLGSGSERTLDYNKIKELFSEGLTQREIAERLDYSAHGVSYALSALDISIEERQQRKAGATAIPVVCIDPNTKEILEYDSLSEAIRVNGGNSTTHITDAMKENRKAFGYHWKYRSEISEEDLNTGYYSFPLIDKKLQTAMAQGSPVVQLDLDMKYVATYYSIGETVRKTGVSASSIRRSIAENRAFLGFFFKNAEDYKKEIEISVRNRAKKLEEFSVEKLILLAKQEGISVSADKDSMIENIIQEYINRRTQ